MCTDVKPPQENTLLQGTNEELLFMGILIIKQFWLVNLWVVALF